MDKETVRYIIKYFSNLMADDEKLALKYHMYTYKTSDHPKLRSMMIEKAWLPSESELPLFLKTSYEEFELNVAQRIMTEASAKIFFNTCPTCNKLARTPYAKQCRHCGYDWHNLTAAQFKMTSSFQLTGRLFFLLGQIIKGEIKKGQRMDLRILGVNKKPVIEAIEFARKSKDGQVWEEIGLGTDDLTEDEKQYLKNTGSFSMPIDILCE
ncbi:hypothetical protein [Chryseobacterium sp.]|uniref:hypothetical protein n=1 Tax=Chryseobacterium sp. TaxID=1871047 RepID=UPI0024E1A0F8|nr:hypothetical protein [Chryseobacterium sp.]